MYHTFYNLNTEPFRLSPDYRFCYSHKSYKRAKTYMGYALHRGEGFVVVTGEPGTGKSTLIEDLFADLKRKPVVRARLVSTQLHADDLLRMVAFSFGIAASGLDKATVLLRLTDTLIRHKRGGRKALLVVDEAQDLAPNALEELRLLTNLQEESQPLLQIFLVGQQELRQMIRAKELEQLHQRIIAACHLDPLRPEETRAYVEHRLTVAGWRGDPCITDAAFDVIHQFSAGIPRRINLVCSRLFLHGSVEEKHQLKLEDVRIVLKELQEEHLGPRDPILEEFADILTSASSGYRDDCVVQGNVAKTENLPKTENVPVTPLENHIVQSLQGGTSDITTKDVESAPKMRTESGAGRQHANDDMVPQLRATPVLKARPPSQRTERTPVVEDIKPPARPRTTRSNRLRWPALFVLVMLAAGWFVYALEVSPMGGIRNYVEALLGKDAGMPTEIQPDNESDSTGRSEGATTEATSPTLPDEPRTDQGAPASGGAYTVRRTDRERSAESTVGNDINPREPTDHDIATGPRLENEEPLAEPTERISADIYGAESITSDRKAASAEWRLQTPATGADENGALTAGARLAADPRFESQVTPRDREPSLPDRADGQRNFSEDNPHPADNLKNPDVGPIGTSALPSQGVQTYERIQSLEKALRRLPFQVNRFDDGVIEVNLGGAVPFARNSAAIDKGASVVLDQLAEVLRPYKNIALRVVGHTDSTGPEEYNVALSKRRAEAVAKYLERKANTRMSIVTEGRGSKQPMVPHDSANRKLNRRTVIYIREIQEG